jgi:hypothetical protein
MTMPGRAKRLLAATGTVGVALSLTVAAPAAADPSWRVVASGLHSPRNLAVSPDGDVFVAESGRGGDGPCTTHPALGDACVGSSGSITWVNPHGRDTRVVTGLPSIAGEEALGPMDLVVDDDGRWVASIGLGGDLALRDSLGRDGRNLGTLLTGELGEGGWERLADIVRFEERANPDGTDIDTNPSGLARAGDGVVLADAGGNAVLRVGEEGRVRTVAALGPTAAGADAVPTAVVRGPDGAWYVSQLTGFPFAKGSSSIWRIGSSGVPTVYASGLTNVTDLAFHGRTLYAVQLSTEGLLTGPPGSLVRVPRGSTAPTVVLGDLFFPYGLAITGGSAYVSTCSVCLEGGEVLKVSLR